MAEIITFHWADYLIFCASLLIGAAIGIFHGCTGPKQKTVNDVLMGGKSMGIVPIALSIQASSMSAILILGGTAEVYCFGTMMFTWLVAEIVVIPFLTFMFIPFIRRDPSIINAYEYFEKRFNRVLRYCISATFCIVTIIYLAVALYAPALAFNQVTGLPMWISLFATGAVCTFYTALGGMKAVVWTDVFQMFVFVGGLTFLMIKGVIICGGLSSVFRIAQEGDRLEFFRYDISPYARHTIWTQFIGSIFSLLTLLCSQSILQRFLAMKTTREAQWANVMSRINSSITMVIIAFLGLIIYAYYATCDPLTTKKVQKADQIILLYVMEILGSFHGLPGLFTSSVFAAALSTVSSGVNSMAAVIFEDLVKPLYIFVNCKAMRDSIAAKITQILSFVIGFLCIGLAYGVGTFGRTIMQIAVSIVGAMQAPIFATFLMGMFLPFVNSWGALAGLIISVVLNSCLSIGAIRYSPPPKTLKFDTSGCSSLNYSHYLGNNTTSLLEFSKAAQMISSATEPSLNSTVQEYPLEYSSSVFSISYMWYPLIGVIIAVTVASLVSILTGCNKKNPVNKNLLYFGHSSSMSDTAGSDKCPEADAMIKDKEAGLAGEDEIKL